MAIPNPNPQTDNALEVMRSVIDEEKIGMFTCMPGTVVEYSAGDNRAVVEGSVYQATWNPDEKRLEHRPRPQIFDVPVLQMAGGGFRVQVPLSRGDQVMLLFSCRPLDNWKLTQKAGPAVPRGLMRETDAVAVPGFTPLSAGVLDGQGLVLQDLAGNYIVDMFDEALRLRGPADGDEDTRALVEIRDTDVNIKAPRGRVVIENLGAAPAGDSLVLEHEEGASSVEIDEGSVVISGKNTAMEGEDEKRATITIDGANITLSAPEGTIGINAKGNITVRSEEGNVDVSSGSGNVRVKADNGDLSLEAPNGDITLVYDNIEQNP